MSEARQIAAALLDGSEGLRGFLSRHPSKTQAIIDKVAGLGFKWDYIYLVKEFRDESTSVQISVKVGHEPKLSVAPTFGVDYTEHRNGKIYSDYGLFLRATPAVLRAFETLVQKLTNSFEEEKFDAWLEFADNTRI